MIIDSGEKISRPSVHLLEILYKIIYSSQNSRIMKKNNSRAAKVKPTIQCVEVLVSKDVVSRNGHNLHWTLCVYSLENEPVQKDFAPGDSAVFHFMVYDWNRTIKQLLDTHQVPYSIIQFFTPESLFPQTPEYGLQESDANLLLALHNFESVGQLDTSSTAGEVAEEEDAHFTL